MTLRAGNTKGGNIIDLMFDWFGISCMTTDNFCFYLQNRLIQTSQKQEVNDTVMLPPLVLPAQNNGLVEECTLLSFNHRYRKAKIDCISLFMCPLLAQLKIGFFSSFSAAAVYSTNETNKAGLKQSIIFRCLWF